MRINGIIVIFINLIICCTFSFILIFFIGLCVNIYRKTPVFRDCVIIQQVGLNIIYYFLKFFYYDIICTYHVLKVIRLKKKCIFQS